MNAETINFVAMIILGVLGLAAIVAYAYAKRKGDETLISALYPYQALAEQLVAGLDKVLAQSPYATALKPVHEMATAVGTLIDEPTDFAVQLLPGDILSIALKVVELLKDVTDGKSPAMPDGTRLETIADMGSAPAIGVGVGVGDAADREAAG